MFNKYTMQNRLNLKNRKTSTVPCSVVKHAGSALRTKEVQYYCVSE